MKAVIGILLIFTGFAIDYLVLTNKLPPTGGIQPPVSNSSSSGLPTTSNTSNNFAATSGQGSSSTLPVYTAPGTRRVIR